MQPGCSLPLVAIQKDDHQPRGGEKQAGLRLPPQLQLQGCSSSSLEWRASQVEALPSAWAGDPLLPPAFGGEGCSPALQRRRTSAMWGRLATCCQLQRVRPFGLDGFGAASNAASCRSSRGVAVRPPCGRRSRRARVQHIHPFSCPPSTLGGRTRRCTPWGWRRVHGWSCPHSHRRTGVRTPSCVLRQPLLVRLPVAEVVASAGETIEATCDESPTFWL
jgi:hypothetical protein